MVLVNKRATKINHIPFSFPLSTEEIEGYMTISIFLKPSIVLIYTVAASHTEYPMRG
jgi:hypothetical protein